MDCSGAADLTAPYSLLLAPATPSSMLASSSPAPPTPLTTTTPTTPSPSSAPLRSPSPRAPPSTTSVTTRPTSKGSTSGPRSSSASRSWSSACVVWALLGGRVLGDQDFFGGLEGSAEPHAPVEVRGHVDYSDLLQLRAILLRDSNITLDEILGASKSAAKATAQVAAAAKALAMDKAAIGARAVAAAKKALELVASFEEKYDQTEDLLVNNKMEKQDPVKLLYKRQKLFHVNDEELARKLHHRMNSSPRISKNSAS